MLSVMSSHSPDPTLDPIPTYFQWSLFFHFCSSSFSVQTLVVGSSLELNVTVTLWNEGEDSYGTVIHFYYPTGLSYRRVLGTQVNICLVL